MSSDPVLTALVAALHQAARRELDLEGDVSREEARRRGLGLYSLDDAARREQRVVLDREEPLPMPEGDPTEPGLVHLRWGAEPSR